MNISHWDIYITNGLILNIIPVCFKNRDKNILSVPLLFNEYREIIPDYESFLSAINRPFPTHIRINTLKSQPEMVLSSMKAYGADLKQSMRGALHLYNIEGLKLPGNTFEFTIGEIHVQAMSSCLAPLALKPLPETKVLDLCSSPGGKTSYLAQLMDNSGFIVANELYNSRHVALGANLSRLGVTNTVITGYQAQEFPYKVKFDFILADVPCTGDGRFRNLSKEKTHYMSNDFISITNLQKKIILRAYDLLADGGVLLYSTCTYNPSENEAVVDYLLKNRLGSDLDDIDLAVSADPGIGMWKDFEYDKRVRKTMRIYPHRNDTVGFFMARIVKGCRERRTD